MDDWDQETLEKVIESKNAEYQQNKPTDIVCTILKLLFAHFISVSHYLTCHFQFPAYYERIRNHTHILVW